MRSLAGCRSCGHVQLVQGEAPAGKEVGDCPKCGRPFRGVGLLGAHLLAQATRETERASPWRDSAGARDGSPQSSGATSTPFASRGTP